MTQLIEKIKEFTLREKILLFIFIITLILVIYYNFLYKPLMEKMEILNLEQERKLEETELLNRLSTFVLNLEQKSENIQKHLQEITFWEKESKILQEIEFLLNDLEIDLLNYQTDYGEDYILFDISLAGDYFLIINLMENLKKWETQIDFEILEILTREDNMIELNMKLNLIKSKTELYL